ncbi:hypothetical protein N9P66_02325 [Salibacteraceae bacterium]|nr:hypothetical protein [Salibacteraceae bacterium]MDA9267185.1 hypothetical protein [Salibacteraceae bacterium]MDB4104834.1 hypothetical protein [Salibacteraceae bacterium]MDB9708883.1 hypothetical protein [Salibacteraceae bacterium]
MKVKFKVMDENGKSIKGTTISIYDKNKLIGIKENAPAKITWKLESDSY